MKKAAVVCLCLALMMGCITIFNLSGQRTALAREKAEEVRKNEVLHTLYDQIKKEMEEAAALSDQKQETLAQTIQTLTQENEALKKKALELAAALEKAQDESRKQEAARDTAQQALSTAQTESRAALEKARQEAEAAAALARQEAEEQLRALTAEKEEAEKRLNEALSVLTAPSIFSVEAPPEGTPAPESTPVPEEAAE